MLLRVLRLLELVLLELLFLIVILFYKFNISKIKSKYRTYKKEFAKYTIYLITYFKALIILYYLTRIKLKKSVLLFKIYVETSIQVLI